MNLKSNWLKFLSKYSRWYIFFFFNSTKPNLFSRPVSAYALFFRDTQAAIKGQNPNASFGEVSKIVASMWDTLDAEHKNVSLQFENSLLHYIFNLEFGKG
jgi:hypothetical protein